MRVTGLRQKAFASVVLVAVLCLGMHPAFAESGFWDKEIPNIAGRCTYRVYYRVPDEISTNVTQIAEVTFLVMQLGGTTEAAKTSDVQMQIQANGKTWLATIAREVRELKANQSWGPLRYNFKILDSDFGLNPQQAVTGKISILVNFYEVGLGRDWPQNTAKEGINVEIRSSTVPTSIDYAREFIEWLAQWWWVPVTLTIAVVVVISISISIRVRL